MSIHGWICAATRRSVKSVRGAAAVVAGSDFKWFAMIGTTFAGLALAQRPASAIAVAKRATRSGWALVHADIANHALARYTGAMASSPVVSKRAMLRCFAIAMNGSTR